MQKMKRATSNTPTSHQHSDRCRIAKYSGQVKLPPFPFVVLDTETTGLFPRVHKIVELALVRKESGETVDTYEQLYRSSDELPPHVQVLTRIRPEDLQGKPMFAEHLDELRARIGSDVLLVGQNLGFDLDMLRAEGWDLRENPWIDTSMLASLVFPELASYSLGYMSAILGLRHDPVHRALGDVRATLELFGRIWTRIECLPAEHLTALRETFLRSAPGYQRLAEHLPRSSRAKRIPWSLPAKEILARDAREFPLPPAASGSPLLLEDSLDPHALHHLINALLRDTPREKGGTTWVAVKNLEATLRHLALPPGVRVLHPPPLLLDPDAAAQLQQQETFTADEATLAIKLHWFPARVREDLPIHGGERDVWNGKLACTAASPLYTAQFQNPSPVVLLDHRQLLCLLTDPDHSAYGALRRDHTIIIDDASMLEDTATKAYGHHLAVSDLRAAAAGRATLTAFVDLLELWIAQVRGSDDIHLLAPHDRARRETKGLRAQLAEHMEDASLPLRAREHLRSLAAILEEDDAPRIVWIEHRQNRIALHAAPESAAQLLHQTLFSRFPTVLLSPPGFATLPEITLSSPKVRPSPLPPTALSISYPTEGAASLLENPPPGKTIFLLPSKRVIEEYFVRFTERLEERGTTLICQGLSGGQGRMEAEFSAAPAPALLLLTPWTYEGFDLPPETADRLVIDALPFDHPSDLLIQVRSKHYADAFSAYALPRLKLRLFRLLRTFCRHRKEGGDVRILDRRIHEKKYGEGVRAYLEQFSTEKPSKRGEQMKMF